MHLGQHDPHLLARVLDNARAKAEVVAGAFDGQQPQMPRLEQILERGADLPHELERENVAGRMPEHQRRACKPGIERMSTGIVTRG